jgi:CBS domain containing-hemolysin-like protein
LPAHDDAHGGHGQTDGLTEEELKIIQSTMELRELSAESIMILKEKMFSVDINEPITTPFLYKIHKRGFSKIPVFDGDKNNIVGVISSKFLVTSTEFMGKPLGKSVKISKPVYVARDQNLLELLKIFQNSNTTFALITDRVIRQDEIGGSTRKSFHPRPEGAKEDEKREILGLVTLKDLFAKIVSVELKDDDEHFYSVVRLLLPR